MKALQLIVALAFLVIIHEFGHFILARIFGIKVEKFYMFFNPGFSLFKWKPGRHLGAGSAIKFSNPEARAEYEEDQRLEKAESEYSDAYNAEKKSKGDPEAKSRLCAAKAQLDSCIAARTARFDAEYEQEKKESRWKRFWGHTVYGIGWLPLGGYCKIAGMIDESMDTAQMAQEPREWEFRSKAAWKRLLVMIGGVLFNFILAIVIYAGIAYHWGDRYIPFADAYEGFDFVSTALNAGFRNGDIPLTADGHKLDASESDCIYRLASASTVTVLRNHKDTVSISLPDNFLLRLNDDKGLMSLRIPVVVDRLVAGGAASKAGLREGDHIVAVDSIATPSFTELSPALLKYADTQVNITVERDGDKVTLSATPDSYGKLGFQLRQPVDIYPTVTQRYTLLESVPRGWQIGTATLTSYVSSLKQVFTREGAQSLGGFGAIGNMFPERWNWLSFWQITAFLSVVLAFMNIIPIPGLDGGHVMFLLYEIITRRKPSENFLIGAQYVGMAFLLLLLVYANGNDLFKAFFK